MSSLVWAFGPSDRYIVKCKVGDKWDIWYDNLPSELDALMKHEVAACAFGAGDSFVCIYAAEDGKWELCSRDIPDELHRFLSDLDAESLGEVKVSLGPKTMFFASSGQKNVYGNWPSHMRLKKHLDGVDGKSFPAIVQIGVQNRYVIVGEERDNTTILTDFYGSLGSEIRALSVDAANATDEREIVFLALDPFDRDNYIFVSKAADGRQEVFFKLPAALMDVAAKVKEIVEGTTFLSQTLTRAAADVEEEEELITAEDVTNVLKALDKAQQAIDERDATIAKYEEIFADYNETLEAATIALKQKNETIADYEKLVAQLRDRRQNDAARQIREANQQANVDFALRQRLQTLQYNTQMQCTAMVNMNTQANVAMQNIASSMWF